MRVSIHLESRASHIQGIICGFLMLQDQGIADVSFDLPSDRSVLRDDALISADVDGKKIIYDLMDGYVYQDPEAAVRIFQKADIIFKRSFSSEQNSMFPMPVQGKMLPLGLNYDVRDPRSPLTPRPRNPLRRLDRWYHCSEPAVKTFEAEIQSVPKEPKILFMTRLWDPASENIKGSPELQRQWQQISQDRIALIRLLKKSFPGQVFSGVYGDGYARRCCPDLILPNSITNKRVYLRRMKATPICISSTGLHGSIGWRTAEYVAAGRAIVTEELRYSVPGGFEAGRNYLGYDTNEGCVWQVEKLVRDPELILEMSRQNVKYYREWLRPDRQVLHSLIAAGCMEDE